jgi:uncharacterized lipoprotein
MQRGGVFMLTGLMRIILTALCIISIAGCGSSKESKSNVQSYPQDGYMGITSVNPNNPMNSTYHHYQDDSDLMKAVLAQFPDIKDSRITLRGPNADVKLRFHQGLDAAREDEIRSAAHRALMTNMPRYRVNVSAQRR